MPNSFFQFKQFAIHQDRCAMKVTTDACLFGAWIASGAGSRKSEIKKILDIGTGTGLLSLMLAQKNNQAIIDAIEIDKDSYHQAKQNVAASPFADSINVLYGDVRKYSFEQKYQLIISNPPFYENEWLSDNTKKNIAHHHEGLLLTELLSAIKNNLTAEGMFCLLLPYKRSLEIKDILFQHEFTESNMIMVRQSVNHDYFRIMIAGKIKTGESPETLIDEISICDDKKQYTIEFTELLKDYYLYL